MIERKTFRFIIFRIGDRGGVTIHINDPSCISADFSGSKKELNEYDRFQREK